MKLLTLSATRLFSILAILMVAGFLILGIVQFNQHQQIQVLHERSSTLSAQRAKVNSETVTASDSSSELYPAVDLGTHPTGEDGDSISEADPAVESTPPELNPAGNLTGIEASDEELEAQALRDKEAQGAKVDYDSKVNQLKDQIKSKLSNAGM